MPYPIAKLPYGLRRRLGELATPNERYSLQIAAGNAAICPPKLQSIKKISKDLQFLWRNGAISVVKINSWTFASLVYNEDSLIHISRTDVVLCQLDFQSILSDTFGNFLLRPSCLHLYNCVISKPFLVRLSKLTSGSVKLLNIDSIFCDDQLLFGCVLDNLNAFPLLEKLEFTNINLPQNWISDILVSKPQKVMSISVRVTSFQFHTFEHDELITLLRTQPQGFYMSIVWPWRWCERLDKFFDGCKSHLDQRLINCDNNDDDNDDDDNAEDDDWYFDDDSDDDYDAGDDNDDSDDNDDGENQNKRTTFEMTYKGKKYCWYLPTDQANGTTSNSSDDSGNPVAMKQKTTSALESSSSLT